jgi:hypothetical protein
VSSRRQTRLTALDLIGYAAADERPRQYVHCPEEELEQALVSIKACILPCLLLPLHDGQQDFEFLLILCYVLAYSFGRCLDGSLGLPEISAQED